MPDIKGFLRSQVEQIGSPESLKNLKEMEERCRQLLRQPGLTPESKRQLREQLHQLHKLRKQEKSLSMKVTKAVLGRLLK